MSIRLFSIHLPAILSCMLVCTSVLSAQTIKPNPIAPVLSPVLPAGMQRGTRLEITLVGKNLTEPTGLLTTFPAKIEIPTDKNNGKDAAKLRVRIELPADAPMGWHTIRLATKQGISNLRMFCIDDLPQFVENGKNQNKANAQQLPPSCVVAGRIDNLGSDYYQVNVNKGQTLSFDVIGKRLGGPIDPHISIYSAMSGLEVAHASDTPGLQSDCRLTHTFKEPGKYVIQVKDILNRGGADYIYRLRVGEFACATVPIPMAVQRGSKTTVDFAGSHIQNVSKMPVAAPNNPLQDVLWIAPPGKAHGWPVALLLSDQKELVEQEPNNELAKANQIPVPCGVTGRFTEYGDIDYFRFAAKKGKRLTIQTHTLELYSPTRVYMMIKDAKGKQLAATNPAAKRPTDQLLNFSPSADGDYMVAVQHLNYLGDSNQAYRLTVSAPETDFSVSLELDRLDIAQGGTRVLPIQVSRQNYSGPIDVNVKTKHPSITGKLTISKGAKFGRLMLHAKEDAPIGPYALEMTALATLNGKKVVRLVDAQSAVSASLGGLLFPPRHLHNELGLAVTPKLPFQLAVAFNHPEAAPGLASTVTVTVKRDKGFDGAVTILPPDGYTGKVKLPKKINPIAKGKPSTSFSVTLDPKTPLGEHAIVVTGQTKVNGKNRIAYAAPATLVVSRPVALKVEPPSVQLKQGQKTKIKITAVRKAGYTGPIKLQVRNLPKNVTATTVTIAKGKNEAQIDITAANNAAIGEQKTVNVLATATAAGNQTQASPNFTVKIEKK